MDIAIKKFLRSSPLATKDSVFSVRTNNFDGKIIGVSIYGSTIKPYITKKENYFSYSALPSHYLEAGGKLFYWDENNEAGTPDVARVLEKYHFIDTAYLSVIIPEHFVDDKKKGEHYYFCRSDIRKFKRVRTNKGIGSYPIPNLGCEK